MMRYVRRACRQWRDEFLTFWGRFNTFFRMVFGIALAMTMVFGARRQALDAHRRTVVALGKELNDKNVPIHVPEPGSDNEVQEAELLTENLQAALAREREETRAVLEQYRNASQDCAREAIETLTRLIGKHGLMVLKATRCECQDQFPLPRLCQSYVLAGDFTGVFGFLQDAAALKTPCRLRQVVLGCQAPHHAQEAFTPSPSAMLLLTFLFESFYVEP